MTIGLLARVGVCLALSMTARAGLASPHDAAPPADTHAAALVEPPAAGPSPASERRAEVVMRALSLLGVHYRFGGNTPETGLDCSGFVRHVFREAVGLMLPRRSVEISRAGKDVSGQQLTPGDLVFFNTLRRTFSHVGIYIGDNRFVHAPSAGGQVRVEALDKRYWQARFSGARRLGSPETIDLPHLGELAELAPAARD